MIDKLHIKNFLAFPELVVPELKLINLVAGKNTAGKTGLLQALDFLYANDKLKVVEDIRQQRKLDFGGIVNRGYTNLDLRNVASQIDKFIIGLHDIGTYKVLKIDGGQTINYEAEPFSTKSSIFVKPTSTYKSIVDAWGKIALTKKEVEVIDIVNTTLSLEIERVSITNDEIKVLLKNEESPIRIETLGDGTKRVMSVALSLTESKNSLLLIDEIETHLHHSVIRKLWKIIFEYAIKWNIQVVATTHSQDAIREFWYEAATEDAYKQVSQVLRLQIGREGKHEVVQFPFERLDTVMEMEMEIR